MNKVLLSSALCVLPLLAQADWFPVPVRADGALLDYQPLASAQRPWRICVLLPHGLDRYWWGVSWGVDDEARRLGVRLGIYEARGYSDYNVEVQRQQLLECQAKKADGYLIASINARGLCPQIDSLKAEGRPVIDLVNGIDCPGVIAHSRVSYADMARTALDYIEQHKTGGAYSLGWLPGPETAAWVQDADQGVKEAQSRYRFTLVHGGYGMVNRTSQAPLARALLEGNPHLDVVFGNAEAASFAAPLIGNSQGRYRARVVSLYATQRIIEQIRQGEIVAAPTDSSVIQGRIGLDLLVRALEGKPYFREVGPIIEMIDRHNLDTIDMTRLMSPDERPMIREELPD